MNGCSNKLKFFSKIVKILGKFKRDKISMFQILIPEKLI